MMYYGFLFAAIHCPKQLDRLGLYYESICKNKHIQDNANILFKKFGLTECGN